jgi:hypothetical protein
VTPTVVEGVVKLVNLASNYVAATGSSLTLQIPDATPGFGREFSVYVNNRGTSAPIALTWTTGTGAPVTFYAVNVSLVMESAPEDTDVLFMVHEFAENKFAVARMDLKGSLDVS